MNLRELALRTTVLKVAADEVTAWLGDTKLRLEEALTEAGASQAVPELPDGTKIATVSLAGGAGQAPSITDENTFLAWVTATHPEETVTVVRDNYRKKLLDEARRVGKPVDPVTGELVPGITMRPASRHVSIRFRPGGRDAVVAAWQAGQLEDPVSPARPVLGEATPMVDPDCLAGQHRDCAGDPCECTCHTSGLPGASA